MKIILKGRIPSKKNSKTIVCRGKYPMMLGNPRYQAWHEDAAIQMMQPLITHRPLLPIKNAKIVFTMYAPDKRAADLSNKIESVMDLLVDVGFLVDDNWFVIGDIHMIFGGVDKENPRAELDITPTG